MKVAEVPIGTTILGMMATIQDGEMSGRKCWRATNTMDPELATLLKTNSVVALVIAKESGLTLRFDVVMEVHLLSLEEEFRKLSMGVKSSCDLAGLSCVRLYGIESLKCLSTGSHNEEEYDSGPFRLFRALATSYKQNRIEFTYSDDKKFKILWRQNADDWLICAEKMERLTKAGLEGGHQYLTEEGLDSLIVKVCFREDGLRPLEHIS